jgi:hypothetical protein
VAFGIVGLDRQEGAGPDMQRHLVQADTALVEPPKQPVREMQTSCRGRHGTFLMRKQGLIVDAVLIIGGPAGGDIGR